MAELWSVDSDEIDSELVESSQETNCCVCRKSEPEEESEDFVFVGMQGFTGCNILYLIRINH